MTEIKYSEHWTKLRESFLYLLKEKNFKKITNYNNVCWVENIKELEWEELIHYFLMVGIAYQELWELDKADLFYDFYLSLVNIESLVNILTEEWIEQIKNADDSTKKFYLLMYEIDYLWFKYKISKQQYEKS